MECPYCKQDSGGNHEDGCPNKNAPSSCTGELLCSVPDSSAELIVAEKLADLCIELVRLLRDAPNVAPHGRRDSDVPCRRLVGRWWYVRSADRWFNDEAVAFEFCVGNEGPILTCRGCAGEVDDAECKHPNINKRACWHAPNVEGQPRREAT